MLLTLAFAVIAAAQPPEEEIALIYGDKAYVRIATGSEQSISHAPSVATVITAEEIAAMGAIDLDQALESVPGLHVSKSHVVSKPIYSIRGIHTLQNSQVLMLVNGIPITNVFQGDRSQIWGGMPLENVARIEIIRGPGSALYGADAFAGVINIITKTADDIDGTELGVRGGSFNTWDAWLQHGGKLGPLDAALYLRGETTDGQKEIVRQDAVGASGPINEDGKAFDARVELSKDAWRLRGAYQYRKLGAGAGVAGALDPNARVAEDRWYLDLSYEQPNLAQNWELSGVAGYYEIYQHQPDPYFMLFPPGTVPGYPNGMIGSPGHSERHLHAGLSAFYTGFEHHRVHFGTGVRYDDLYEFKEAKNFDANFAPLPGVTDATGNPGLVALMPHDRFLYYGFVQEEWHFARDWTLTAGIRHDHYSDFGGTTNPRLALVWDTGYNVVVKAMHGEAFRAPTFVEQYAINNPVQSGTPDIKPETIQTDELVFAWQPTGKVQTNLSLFRYQMRNIIQLVNGRMQNAGDQTGQGLELESTWDANDSLRLNGSYSMQYSHSSLTGQDAGLAPHHRLFARADWRFMPLWQFGATVNHVMDREREQGDSRPKTPDYTTVNLNLRREKIADNWQVSLMVYNLFNSNAYEPTFRSIGMGSDLPLPGRSLYLQVQLNF
jgi:iron complex outermembrane receptor protein